MNKETIKALVQKYTKKVQDKYPEFKEPIVTFFNTTAKAGVAQCSTHTVSFNTVLAAENSTEFENTISHEIAHLVTRMLYPNAKQHHGPEFKRVHQWLGGTGETYHTYDTSSVKKTRNVTTYKYTCNCTTYEISAKRHDLIRNKGKQYKCTKCSCRLYPVVRNGYLVTNKG